jgi:hypothetical protein
VSELGVAVCRGRPLDIRELTLRTKPMACWNDIKPHNFASLPVLMFDLGRSVNLQLSGRFISNLQVCGYRGTACLRCL